MAYHEFGGMKCLAMRLQSPNYSEVGLTAMMQTRLDPSTHSELICSLRDPVDACVQMHYPYLGAGCEQRAMHRLAYLVLPTCYDVEAWRRRPLLRHCSLDRLHLNIDVVALKVVAPTMLRARQL